MRLEQVGSEMASCRELTALAVFFTTLDASTHFVDAGEIHRASLPEELPEVNDY